MIAEILKFGVGEQRALPSFSAEFAAVGLGIGQQRKFLRMRDRERAKEHGVEDTEDGGVRTDAQGERQNRHDGEAGTLQQHAQRIPDILK